MTETTLKAIQGSIAAEHRALKEDLHSVLDELKKYLELDVAYISEFQGDKRLFKAMEVEPHIEGLPFRAGLIDERENSICQRLVDGRVPHVITDCTQNVETKKLLEIYGTTIGTHIGVPIVFDDGRIYGTICSFSQTPNLNISDKDVKFVKLLADFVGKILQRLEIKEAAANERRITIQDIIKNEKFTPVFQPIVDIETGVPFCFEALTRFKSHPHKSPDLWLTEAQAAGLRTELEIKLVEKCVEKIDMIPQPMRMTVNVSSQTLLKNDFQKFLSQQQSGRLTLEITEHDIVEDYDELSDVLKDYKALGCIIAIDDVGSGYSSLRHIVRLQPDILKIDRELISGIDQSRSKRAVLCAIYSFAEETGAQVIAEGIERSEELSQLLDIGIKFGQGFLLGRPNPVINSQNIW